MCNTNQIFARITRWRRIYHINANFSLRSHLATHFHWKTYGLCLWFDYFSAFAPFFLPRNHCHFKRVEVCALCFFLFLCVCECLIRLERPVRMWQQLSVESGLRRKNRRWSNEVKRRTVQRSKIKLTVWLICSMKYPLNHSKWIWMDPMIKIPNNLSFGGEGGERGGNGCAEKLYQLFIA